ncbi:zinc finger, CCHC-type containing LTR copia-type gag-polypeptide [Tanacetum coccineum]
MPHSKIFCCIGSHSLCVHLRNLSKRHSTVSEFVGRQFKGICDKLAAIGQPVDEMDKLHWFVCGLGASFETFSTAIRTTKPFTTFRDLLSQAESHEMFLKSLHGSATPPAAFFSQQSGSRSSQGLMSHQWALCLSDDYFADMECLKEHGGDSIMTGSSYGGAYGSYKVEWVVYFLKYDKRPNERISLDTVRIGSKNKVGCTLPFLKTKDILKIRDILKPHRPSGSSTLTSPCQGDPIEMMASIGKDLFDFGRGVVEDMSRGSVSGASFDGRIRSVDRKFLKVVSELKGLTCPTATSQLTRLGTNELWVGNKQQQSLMISLVQIFFIQTY